ncbi:MAG: glycerophosphodiester phosphodiesterase [Candidatus Hydrogenedentes bacterium]|nr:glycerophosphodiester phosphodiesterase [Candidatus Hydrogenedentota bacterium]
MPVRRVMFGLTIAVAALASVAWAEDSKIVIAHRGASGYVPEHTLESYAMAHAMGATYIEPDLVLTKDKVFVCMHDIHLQATTNVEEVYPDRKREDGQWYAADFTLEEIKRLSVHERLKNRFPQGKSHFEVPTFAEMIELVQGLNQTTGREAGIYPELKNPGWHAKNGLPMEEAALAILTQYGYVGKDAKVFIQCFEPEPLERIRKELKSELPLIMLVSNEKESAPLITQEGLKYVATFANGIGPDRVCIEKDPDLVKQAHDLGLAVHPYTFRADQVSSKYASFTDELKQFYVTYGVDGLFTDHCDKAVAFLRENK